MGREFGATTGRARRCGWFDAVATRYSSMINGIDKLAITNLDGLDHVKTIRVCVGYRLEGCVIQTPPILASDVEKCEPIYQEVSGWNCSTTDVRTYKELPLKAQKYVQLIAKLTRAKVAIISVGASRAQTICVESN